MPIGNRAIARSADISNTMVIVFIMLIAALFGPVWSPRAGGIEAAAAEPPEGGSCVEPDASPLWTGSPAAERRAAQAMAELASAGAEGLDPADYAVAPTFQSPIAFECALNVAVRRYAEDMRRGHVRDADRGRDVLLPASDFDAASEMYSAALGGRFSQFLVDLRPLHPEYAFLRLALQRYRNIAATGGWSAVPGELDLREPVSGAALDTLRKRLAAEDIDVAADSRGDNADILPALLRYQRRNGLEADGIIGPRTLAMLNVPASERVAQIIANMERWRWLPRSFESRHVRVNVADASLQGWSDGDIVFETKVIVGTPATPTPILRAVATDVTLNPAWTVPMSIATREILPRLQDDPLYLMNSGMVIQEGAPSDPEGLSVEWDSLSGEDFPFRLRQAPGPDNPLGRIKLEMPNGFSVFLHDTPARAAFASNERALSHGCIRVENIKGLASFGLSGDPELLAGDLEARLEASETQHLPLPEPLPIYILYWTVFRDADGQVAFRPDLYGRDRELTAAMAGDTVIAPACGNASE